MADYDTAKVKIAGRPELIKNSGRMGRAIRVPLSVDPDQEWRQHFATRETLSRFFPRVQFEEGGMLAYFSSSNRSAISHAMDELQEAIDYANQTRAEEAARHDEQREELSRRAEREELDVEAGLEDWAERHVPS